LFVEDSPLYSIHCMIKLYEGDIKKPHYIIISIELLEFMQDFYNVERFTVRGMEVIASPSVDFNVAYIYPIDLFDKGCRPWHNE